MITYSLRSVEAATFNARSEDLRSAPVKTLHTCIPHTNLYSLAPKIVRTNLRRSYYSQHPSRTAPVCLDGDKLRAVVLIINSVIIKAQQKGKVDVITSYLSPILTFDRPRGRQVSGADVLGKGEGRDIPYLYPHIRWDAERRRGPVCCLL